MSKPGPVELLKNQMWSEYCCISSAVSGQELKISLESPGHSSKRCGKALCKFSLLPGDQGTSAGCMREQRCIGAQHSLSAEGCVCRKGPHTKERRKTRECDQPRCISLQLVNSSFLPLKMSLANSWHVSSAFFISGQSLVLGELVVDVVAVPVEGHGHAWERNDLFLVEVCGR